MAMDNVELLRAKPTILVVDDSPENLSLMGELLKYDYRVKVANCGEKALKIATADPPPDLILLDIVMPKMDGYEVCQTLKSREESRDIPIIFLTACTDTEDEKRGFDLGAVDYITKPVSPPVVTARVKTHLNLKAAADFLRDQNHFLEKEVSKRTLEVRAIQEVTILALASLAETRDNDTGSHLRRTQHYVNSLAQKLKPHWRFKDFLTDGNIAMLFKSAPLHDIGKVGIPDQILLKPGPLTPEEFGIMKTHVTIGRDAIIHAEKALGINVEFLRIAKEIVHYHHEKWDGSGYPDRLKGDDIPVSARLMALADFYDALTSTRIYRSSVPHDTVAEMIIDGKGTHFDPDTVEAFVELQDEFKRISLQFTDGSDVD